MSKRDARYCVECQTLIEEDYQLRGEKYIPIHYAEVESLIEHQRSDGNLAIDNAQRLEIYSDKQKAKLSILNSPSPNMDNFRPRGKPTTYKNRPLPEDKIKQLHKRGVGARAIATRLKKEQGIVVSYKTIQRILLGKRK